MSNVVECSKPNTFSEPTTYRKFDPCYNDNYYHTSTGIGLKIIPSAQLSNRAWDFKIPKELTEQSVLLRDELKCTVFRESYNWPYNKDDPTNRNTKIPVTSLHYISRFGERLKLDPPEPYQIFKSEYQKQYPYNKAQPVTHNCESLKSKVSCQIMSPGQDLRPTLAPQSEGFSKYFDPYTTSSQLAHHPFEPSDLEKYKHKPVKITPQLSLRIKPVYDDAVFKTKYTEKLLPKVVNHVPHSGMETEMNGKYRLPVDEMVHYSGKEPVSCILPPLTGPSKRDVFLVPSMYQTEYYELGKGISTCTIKKELRTLTVFLPLPNK